MPCIEERAEPNVPEGAGGPTVCTWRLRIVRCNAARIPEGASRGSKRCPLAELGRIPQFRLVTRQPEVSQPELKRRRGDGQRRAHAALVCRGPLGVKRLRRTSGCP